MGELLLISSHNTELTWDTGRIGDGDVHAAYVEFRAKESDKVHYPTSFPLLPCPSPP